MTLPRLLHVDTFKKRYRISQRRLNELKTNGIVRVIQTGYKGHSLAHPRAVVFSPAILEAGLWSKPPKRQPDYPFRYICEGNRWHPRQICGLKFKTKAALIEHQKRRIHNVSEKVVIKD